jgi:mRNA-degrading endonuclease RelE of RelBE toxin-antitoxin system
MTYTVAWENSAIEALKRLPTWQAAARVSRAVLDFARTGQGDVRRLGEGREFRLHISPHVVRLSIDTSAKLICVWGVFTMK